MNGHQHIELEKRQEGIDRLLDYLKGGAPLQSIIEQYPTLDFQALQQEVSRLVSSATASQRADLHFKLALLRSLRYSVASSKHCLVLGAVNGVRELYEGQRLMLQNGTDQ